ncbi:MAG: TraR/DksA family transcriptional regulator [Desulfobacterales bacterium]
MPKSFTDKELENFKDKLLRQKEEAWDEIMDDLKHHASEEYQDLINMVCDQADYALAELKEETVFSFIEHKYEELEKIEQALTRIESGAYGHCIDCGGWIGEARLEVMPAAVRCRKCQEELEKFDGI